ncbi:hypothetical protein [Cytobacillus horneckiae]|uniref:hypothetical protein n=1 Tax=Cytobacillus horneckiae TaxID=549687 RepID=UPI003D9A63BF
MPQSNITKRKPDPFIMKEDIVNEAVYHFLCQKGFSNVRFLRGKVQGIDVQGQKDQWDLWVESKGSTGNDATEDMVFDNGQIKTHADRQIMKLMEYANAPKDKVLFVMANPDIPRIRTRIYMVKNLLDKMCFIQFWVQKDLSIKVEYPSNMEDTLLELSLI